MAGAAHPLSHASFKKNLMIFNETTNWKIVQSSDDLALFFDWMNKLNTFAIDTETAPKNPKIVKKDEVRKHAVNFRLCKIVGASFSDGFSSWYLPFGHVTDEPQVEVSRFKMLFNQYLATHPEFYPIYHNAKFDIKVIAKHLGVDLSKIISFDTFIGHFYFNQEASHKLKFLAKYVLKKHPKTKERMASIDVKFFEEEFDGMRLDVKSISDVAEYALKDPYFTWLMYELILDKFEEVPQFKNAYYNMHVPLINILAQAELRGILINTEQLNETRKGMEQEISKLEEAIFMAVGYPFNIKSPTQLRRIIYGDTEHGGLGLKCKLFTKPSKTKPSGQPSTNGKALAALAGSHDVIPLLLSYRKVSKRIEGFCDPLIYLIDQTLSNVISPDFNIVGARSGRLSCKNPNMQQMPADKAEDTYHIRALFEPRPGHTFIIYDYSQLELRVLAHISKDKELIFAYQNDIDVHQRTADRLGVPRPLGKNMQFAAVYGAAGQKLADMANEKRKPGEKAFTKKWMDNLIVEYFTLYEGVQRWKDKKEAIIIRDGYVETLAGRKRFLPDAKSDNFKKQSRALRSGVNTAIQGSAADIVNLAMTKIVQDEIFKISKACILLQIHDELLIEVPIEYAEELSPRIKNIMEHPFQKDLIIPLKVKGGVSSVWKH